MGSIPTEKETVFRSKLPDIYPPDHLPLHSYCFQNLHEVSDHSCLIDGATDKIYTYAEVELTARCVAVGLHDLGVRRGHIIMLLLPNSPEFAFSFLAASFLGTVSTIANPFYTPTEIHKQTAAAGATLVVTASCHVPKVSALRESRGVTAVVIDELVPEGCTHFSALATTDEARLPEVDMISA